MLFVVGWAVVCQPALDAGGVVEAFDVGEERGPQLVATSPAGCAVDPGELAFERGPEGLDRGVVVAVAGRSEGPATDLKVKLLVTGRCSGAGSRAWSSSPWASRSDTPSPGKHDIGFSSTSPHAS